MINVKLERHPTQQFDRPLLTAIYLLAILLIFAIVSYQHHCEERKLRRVQAKIAKELYNMSKIIGRADKIPFLPTIHHLDALRENPTTIFCEGGQRCDVIHGDPEITGYTQDIAYIILGTPLDIQKLPLPRRPNKVLWVLIHEESPKNNIYLMYDQVLDLFNYSVTYSRNSDIPFPLHALYLYENITSKRHYIATPEKNYYQDEIAPVFYMQAHCDDIVKRDMYVEWLAQSIPVDSYGACNKNKLLPKDLASDYLAKLESVDLYKMIAKYKFAIAIENGVCEDYMTEKFWRAIQAGTVPIYFGATNIRDWLPNDKSAILIEDYPTPELLSEYLYKLIANDSLYEEHLEHKTKGVVRNARLKWEMMMRRYQYDQGLVTEMTTCFLCKRLYELKQGNIRKSVLRKSQLNCPNRVTHVLSPRTNPDDYGLDARIAFYDYIMEYADRILRK